MILVRWTTSAPFAALITAGLFLLMAALINQNSVDIASPIPTPVIKITPELVETQPETKKPPKPKLTTPPPIDITNAPTADRPVTILEAPKLDPGKQAIGPDARRVPSPVFRISPTYPESCRARGAEGTVLVQFDVDTNGNVVNPVILDSSNSCFNRTVLKAVSGWKYPPAIDNGRAVMRRGVVERFSFQLSE